MQKFIWIKCPARNCVKLKKYVLMPAFHFEVQAFDGYFQRGIRSLERRAQRGGTYPGGAVDRLPFDVER